MFVSLTKCCQLKNENKLIRPIYAYIVATIQLSTKDLYLAKKKEKKPFDDENTLRRSRHTEREGDHQRQSRKREERRRKGRCGRI